MFSDSSNTTINGGTFIQDHSTQMHAATIGFERLQKAVAPGAFHDAGGTVVPSKCDHLTQTAIIKKSMDWILGHGGYDQNAGILWFYGPGGAGKSAISRKIAELCDLKSILLASFFFRRSDPTRNNSESLIATIAYQIAINFPETRGMMAAAIERDPLLLTRSLESQAVTLLVKPLCELRDVGYFSATFSRRLIIIDGLDKCDTPTTQLRILDVISLLFHTYHLPLLILIASRPERHLTELSNAGPCVVYHLERPFFIISNPVRIFKRPEQQLIYL